MFAGVRINAGVRVSMPGTRLGAIVVDARNCEPGTKRWLGQALEVSGKGMKLRALDGSGLEAVW